MCNISNGCSSLAILQAEYVHLSEKSVTELTQLQSLLDSVRAVIVNMKVISDESYSFIFLIFISALLSTSRQRRSYRARWRS